MLPSPRHDRFGLRVVTLSRLQASLDVAARVFAPRCTTCAAWRALDAPLGHEGLPSIPGACYPAHRRLPGRDLHPLEKRSEQRTCLFQSQFERPSRHDAPRVAAYDHQIRALAEASEPARRLMKVEAIGPQTATALVASMGDPHVFKSGRGYAASLGITPRQHSSGGKERLGQITRQGDRYLRTLLVHGARAYLRVVDKKTDAKSAWARRLKERRHVNVVAIALAAKHARIAWAILAHGTEYRPAGPEVVAA